MKFIAIVASLASVAIAANVSTTVTCPECKTPASTNDIVTRSPLPTTSCDSPSLTVVKIGTASSSGGKNPSATGSQTGSQIGSQTGSKTGSQTGSQTGNPTSPPITGGAAHMAGGALAAFVVAVAIL